jgi:hypothetical protein
VGAIHHNICYYFGQSKIKYLPCVLIKSVTREKNTVFISRNNQQDNLAIEFIIPKFIEDSTCFERHTAHHQKLQTVFAASGLYTRVMTGRCPCWVRTQRPVTTCVYKPEAANTI